MLTLLWNNELTQSRAIVVANKYNSVWDSFNIVTTLCVKCSNWNWVSSMEK